MFENTIVSRIDFAAVTAPKAKEWLFKRLQTAWREAAREFFRVVSQRVTVDTGMSMASMLPLAGKVRAAKLLQQKISEERTKPKKPYVTLAGTVHSEQRKTITKGKEAGRRALSSGRHEISFGTPNTPQLVFKFEVVVFQFQIRDLGLDGKEAWNAIEAGREAFLKRWAEVFPEYIRSKELLDWFLTGKLEDRSNG